MNRQYLDPALPRALPRGACRDLRRGLAGVPGRRPRARSGSRSTSSASTTTRAASCGTTRRPGRCGAARVPAAGRAVHRAGLGGLPRRASPTPCAGCSSATATSRSTSPRTAPPSPTRPRADGRVPGPAPRRLPAASTCGAARRAIAAGRRPARLLRLVAARQLRVGARLLEALRHRPRRLRDAAPHAQGQRALLRRGHPEQRRRARGDSQEPERPASRRRPAPGEQPGGQLRLAVGALPGAVADAGVDRHPRVRPAGLERRDHLAGLADRDDVVGLAVERPHRDAPEAGRELGGGAVERSRCARRGGPRRSRTPAPPRPTAPGGGRPAPRRRGRPARGR